MKKLLITAFATFAILSCSSDDKMPCATCDSNGESSSRNYCLYASSGSIACSPMSSKDCKSYGGKDYGNDYNCDNYFRKQAYCFSNDDCEYIMIATCDISGGYYYGDDPTCGGGQQSSSSTTRSSSSSSTDVCDANSYGSRKIGDQLWMTKNLNCYVAGSKCYGNNEANCTKYGRLYTWAAAMGLPSKNNSEYWGKGDDVKRKGVCPEGWHIPNNDEWETLMDFVGWDMAQLMAKSGWNKDEDGYGGGGTDESKFSAMPGGYGNDEGGYEEAGYTGYWWTATESDDEYATSWYISYDEDYDWQDSEKNYLLSVRCLKD